MSGIEVVSLTFGILPILFEVVKSYSSVSKTVRTLRHYSKEVKSTSEQLKVHNGIFLNEVRLLLRLIGPEEDIESMLDNVADQRWTSKHLDDKLGAALQNSFEICHGIIKEIKETIKVMTEEMGKFDVLINQKTKVSDSAPVPPRTQSHLDRQDEKLASTLKRLRGAIKITLDKSQHDRCLSSLRDRNGDLSVLRSQISAFQYLDTAHREYKAVQHRALPRELEAIQSASHKLHEALCSAWCCDDPAHRGHYAKLCIDAQAEAEVRLDLAISCHQICPSGNKR